MYQLDPPTVCAEPLPRLPNRLLVTVNPNQAPVRLAGPQNINRMTAAPDGPIHVASAAARLQQRNYLVPEYRRVVFG